MRQEMIVVILLWLALQVPLGSIVGACIKFGSANLNRGNIRKTRYASQMHSQSTKLGSRVISRPQHRQRRMAYRGTKKYAAALAAA
jgi:hypothetical protein